MNLKLHNLTYTTTVWPYRSDADDEERRRDLEETKRLFYVATTRARDRLYLSAVVESGTPKLNRGSFGNILPGGFATVFAQAALASSGGRVVWQGQSGASHTFRVGSVLPADRQRSEGSSKDPDPIPAVLVDVPMRPAVTRVSATGSSSPEGVQIGPASGGHDATFQRQTRGLVHALIRVCEGQTVDSDRLEHLARELWELGADTDHESDDDVVQIATRIYTKLVKREEMTSIAGQHRLWEVPFSYRSAHGSGPSVIAESVVLRGTIDCLARDGARARRDGSRCSMFPGSLKTGRSRPEHQQQLDMYVAGHPFYARLTTLLDGHHFDRFVEGLCDRFYAPVMGRPSLAPGRYFRLLLVGYFEGIDSERGMAWRATDSLAVRSFLRLAVDEAPPDHSTIARTRRLIDLETHRTVFTWVQQRLVEAGRLTGKTIAIDATTLEANAAMRSIVRRDTGESYQAFLAGLATASGVETPTREGLARLDRKRKKKTSNTDWTNPHDPDAKVTKMKDGRTHLAHKAEHAVDMETGAIVAVTLHGADVGDTTTIIETAIAAAEQVEDAQANVDDRQSLDEIVGDKGYHSNQTLIDLDAVGIRSYVSEPDRGRRDWSKDPEARAPVYGNRRRMRGRRGRRLMRQRGERIERSFAHLYDTGGMRRTLHERCFLARRSRDVSSIHRGPKWPTWA